MKLVTNINDVTNGYNFAKNFKKGFNTNCYVANEQFYKLINNRNLFEVYVGQVAFFLKRNEGFLNLYYYAASIEELGKSLPKLLEIVNDETLVVDLVTTNEFCAEKLAFEENRFNIYTSLIRMSCFEKKPYGEIENSIKIRSAVSEDVSSIRELLISYFDPKAEQLPDTVDLLFWVEQKNIILFEEKGRVVGFIIYDLKVTTLYLRYWFVHPDYRDQKIGSQLFKEFLSRGKDTQRKLFWVIRSNENAIKRYIHYGFKEDKMYNFVLINKQIKYEN
ncbi:MAG: GNAT family N-acetyltransferase [Chitinophagaceae bacterium]|nr:GNAT family N-acetyltransferase [Chitinophagaceae bacterium]MCA6511681.1 GNAT family N-acetyltransferase [Chitinophagaceae bacterium]